MNKILDKKKLASGIFMFRLHAPYVAQAQQPGQFIILQVEPEFGERIPLTLVDADKDEGSITLVVQVVGQTTCLLAELSVGDSVANVVGPLGNPAGIPKDDTVVCVGGGIGVAALYPIAKVLREAGNRVTVIMGAKTKELLIFEDEMRAVSDELILCTDDGSYGRKALVTVPLKEVCKQKPPPDRIIAVGPAVMMKFCAETTRPYHVPTFVSLNAIMVDGIGMCGGCRVVVDGETKFTCVDGPEFDGHQIDFDSLMSRLKTYNKQEEEAYLECMQKGG